MVHQKMNDWVIEFIEDVRKHKPQLDNILNKSPRGFAGNNAVMPPAASGGAMIAERRHYRHHVVGAGGRVAAHTQPQAAGERLPNIQNSCAQNSSNKLHTLDNWSAPSSSNPKPSSADFRQDVTGRRNATSSSSSDSTTGHQSSVMRQERRPSSAGPLAGAAAAASIHCHNGCSSPLENDESVTAEGEGLALSI
jgi:hypothetical protein